MSSNLSEQVSAIERMFAAAALENGTDRLTVIEEARRVISELDGSADAQSLLGLARWISLIQLLQKIAYMDPDSGGEDQIAPWCERQWATVLQDHPENVSALQGLGHAWLLKSQQFLARIQSSDDSLSSQGSNSPTRHRNMRLGCLNHDAEDEDNARINSSDYVEARNLLRPALDLFDRAIRAAGVEASGDLLQLAAEAHISFANVSHPQTNEASYQRALSLLQQASQIEDHTMDPYLREFLDDNISFINPA